MSLLVYTFRTFPWIEDLSLLGQVHVLGSLKKDLSYLMDVIKQTRPKILVGIAKTDGKSSFESLCINRFHGNGSIVEGGPFSRDLFVPNLHGSPFTVSKDPSDSFCNYSMYWLSDAIEKENLNTKIVFVHLRKEDIECLSNVIGK